MRNNTLLESIIKNASSQEAFNFSKSPIQNNFLERQKQYKELPVEIIEKKWKNIQYNDREAIERTFTFNTHDHLMYFVNEVLNHSNSVDHHPIVKINHLIIEVSLCTLDVQQVTELDTRMAKNIDEIYEDILFIDEKI